MIDTRTTRFLRRLLSSPQSQATIFAVLVVATAGCAGVLPGDDGTVGEEPLEDVPAGVDGVMYFDSGIVQDQATVELMNGLIELSQEENPNYDGPESYEELLEEAEEDADIDIEGFQSMLVFGQFQQSDSEYVGGILVSDWTIEDLQEASDDDFEDVEEDTYNGVDVYIQEDDVTGDVTWVADMGDGKFAFGSEQVVKDIIDTNQGDAESFSGDLRDAYEGTQDGYVKAAFSVPEQAGSGSAGPGAGGAFQEADQVSMVTMVYHTDGSQMNVDVEMTATNESAASQLQTDIEDSLSAVNLFVEAQEVQDLIDSVTVNQDGSTVSISFQTTPDDLIAALEASDQIQPPEPDPIESVDEEPVEATG